MFLLHSFTQLHLQTMQKSLMISEQLESVFLGGRGGDGLSWMDPVDACQSQ